MPRASDTKRQAALKQIIENPTGKLHPCERQLHESWTTRWFKMTGVYPKLTEGKRTTTANQARRVGYKLRTKRAACNSAPKNLHSDINQLCPRAEIPDELFHGVQI